MHPTAGLRPVRTVLAEPPRAPESVPAIAFARVQRNREQPAKAFRAAEIKRDEHTFARRVLCLRARSGGAGA